MPMPSPLCRRKLLLDAALPMRRRHHFRVTWDPHCHQPMIQRHSGVVSDVFRCVGGHGPVAGGCGCVTLLCFHRRHRPHLALVQLLLAHTLPQLNQLHWLAFLNIPFPKKKPRNRKQKHFSSNQSSSTSTNTRGAACIQLLVTSSFHHTLPLLPSYQTSER